jgi:putative tryptophan/tyrosine transport system substrate-binding protein
VQRRTLGLLATLAYAFLLAPIVTDAQLRVKVPRIGFLATGGFPRLSCRDPDFLRGLHELGYVEERNIIIEWRCAEGRTDWARQFARELVERGVDVIVSNRSRGVPGGQGRDEYNPHHLCGRW